MEKTEITVEIRKEMGKGASHRARSRGMVPAIFYGKMRKNPVALEVSAKETERMQKISSNTLLTLKGDKEVDGKMALLKDRQIHPVTQSWIHVDFFEVNMDEKIKVSVPVVLIGKAAGVEEGGILQQISRELEIRCLPNQIPSNIEADVTPIIVGGSLHVSDITLPAGVEVVGDVDYTLAGISAPEAEEEKVAAPVAGAVEGDAAAAPGKDGKPAEAAAPAEAKGGAPKGK